MAISIKSGSVYDSQEEVWMSMWLEELQKAGYVRFWRRNVDPILITPAYKIDYVKKIELKTKTKYEEKEFTLLQDLQYTPDFELAFTKKGYHFFCSPRSGNVKPNRYFFQRQDETFFIEVKPTFDQHEKTAKFSLIQKFLWDKYRMFVDLIIPEHLFKDTFMPLAAMDDFRYKKAPTGKNKGKKKAGDWKVDYIPKTLKEFINEVDQFGNKLADFTCIVRSGGGSTKGEKGEA